MQCNILSVESKSVVQRIDASTENKTFTVNKTLYSYSVNLQIGGLEQAGTFNNYKNRYMIYKGTDNKTFELYGVSPSIDYPSEIEAVGDNINIFDGETETGGYSANTGNKNPPDPATIRNVNFINVENLNTVMFSCDGESIAMNVFEYDTDKTFIKMTFNAVDNPFKLSENTAFINFSRSNTIDASKIKIEAGKEVTTYSQYNQGSEKITVLNSNFLEKQEEKTVTWKGLTATVESDGTIVLNGTVTQDCYVQIISELILGNYSDTSNFKKNFFVPGSYQFSCDWEGQSSSSNINAYLRTSAGTSSFNVQILNVNTINSHRYANFNVENVEEYIAYLWIQNGTTFTDFRLKFIVRLQSDTSDYIQNKQKEYVLEVQQEILQGDYFIKEADGWKEVHTLNKKTFDGTENIGTSASGNSFTYVTNDLLNNTSQTDILSFYSNCYVASSWEERNYQSKPNTVASYGNSIGFDKGNFATPEEFKAELAEKYSQGNPMYLYYPLATSTKLSCTEAQSAVLDQISELPLNKGINNVTADDLALLQMTYTVDTKAYIDSKLGSEG